MSHIISLFFWCFLSISWQSYKILATFLDETYHDTIISAIAPSLCRAISPLLFSCWIIISLTPCVIDIFVDVLRVSRDRWVVYFILSSLAFWDVILTLVIHNFLWIILIFFDTFFAMCCTFSACLQYLLFFSSILSYISVAIYAKESVSPIISSKTLSFSSISSSLLVRAPFESFSPSQYTIFYNFFYASCRCVSSLSKIISIAHFSMMEHSNNFSF